MSIHIDALPNEILLEVFKHLSYFDLRVSVPAVCRRFKLLIEVKTKTGALDIKLFRDKPALLPLPRAKFPPSPPRLNYEIHPAFAFISANLGHPLEEVELKSRNPASTQTWTLFSHPIANENAISPAVNALTFVDSFKNKIWIKGTGGNQDSKKKTGAVTILDVIGALAKIFEDYNYSCGAEFRGMSEKVGYYDPKCDGDDPDIHEDDTDNEGEESGNWRHGGVRLYERVLPKDEN